MNVRVSILRSILSCKGTHKNIPNIWAHHNISMVFNHKWRQFIRVYKVIIQYFDSKKGKNLKNRTKINWIDQKQFLLFNNLSNFGKNCDRWARKRTRFFANLAAFNSVFCDFIYYYFCDTRLRPEGDSGISKLEHLFQFNTILNTLNNYNK